MKKNFWIWKRIIGVAAVLTVAIAYFAYVGYSRLHGLTSFKDAEIRMAPANSVLDRETIHSATEALYFARDTLKVLEQKPFPDAENKPTSWAAWVVRMDAKNRKREVARARERCAFPGNSATTAQRSACEALADASDLGFDYWSVTFKTDSFIPSFYCETAFDDSGKHLKALYGEGCGFRK